MLDWKTRPISRRSALGAAAALGAIGVGAAGHSAAQDSGAASSDSSGHSGGHGGHGGNSVVGTVDNAFNGFDPSEILTDFDYGEFKTDEDGRRVREWIVTAVDKEIEIAPGVLFPAWTFNGRVPGPALRCVEGEHLRVIFQNAEPPPFDAFPRHPLGPHGRCARSRHCQSE
jgi:manganese oxidase